MTISKVSGKDVNLHMNTAGNTNSAGIHTYMGGAAYFPETPLVAGRGLCLAIRVLATQVFVLVKHLNSITFAPRSHLYTHSLTHSLTYSY